MNHRKYIELAASVSRLKDDDRNYFLGAVGIRRDGVIVAAGNGNPKEPCPEHHCEFRLLRKLGKGGTVYLARTLADGTWANSTPCKACQKRLIGKEVRMVYYTTDKDEFYWWTPSKASEPLAYKPWSNWAKQSVPGSIFGIDRSPKTLLKDVSSPPQTPVGLGVSTTCSGCKGYGLHTCHGLKDGWSLYY